MRGPAMKWGRGEDYGLHIGDGDEAIIKGHRHFTSGFESRPEDVDMTTLVDLTMLKKSNTRPRDHLVIEPQKINIQDSQIKLAFPQNHKYFSHLSAKDIFPQHKPPTKRVAVVEEQVEDAEDSDDEYDVPPTLVYDREHRPNIQSSTKGCPWRTETINSDWGLVMKLPHHASAPVGDFVFVTKDRLRPAPVARPLEQQVAAETFNQHKSFARKLKETHYTRIHGAAVAPRTSEPLALADYKPNWKHDILRSFNNRHCEPLPDIRTKGSHKKHIFYGVNVMSIEHG
eukprot:sb/3467776/